MALIAKATIKPEGPRPICEHQVNPKTLRSRISGQTNSHAWCDICEMKGHWTSKCGNTNKINAIIAAMRTYGEGLQEKEWKLEGKE